MTAQPLSAPPVALAWRTPDAWAPAALADPRALLSDHAHCELGAAAAAQGLLARRADDAVLVERMAALAVEELAHFRRVHRLLRQQAGALEPARRNPYVERLTRAARADTPAGGGLADRLLVAALVEARSLERFTLLARHAEGPLRALYAELGPSEAGHAALFLELARDRWPRDAPGGPRERLAELARREGALVAGLPFGPRVHSGPPAAGPGVQLASRAAEEGVTAAPGAVKRAATP